MSQHAHSHAPPTDRVDRECKVGVISPRTSAAQLKMVDDTVYLNPGISETSEGGNIHIIRYAAERVTLQIYRHPCNISREMHSKILPRRPLLHLLVQPINRALWKQFPAAAPEIDLPQLPSYGPVWPIWSACQARQI